jgi:hypothetical protein
VTAYFGGGLGRWNSYVTNDGAQWFDASGSPCIGDELGFYSACIHAGEWLTMPIPGASSCTGLSATDALGAFRWTCRDDGGAISFVSTGLALDRGLRDLIDFGSAAWRPNTLTVRDGANALVATSSTGPWHDNPISVLTETSNALSGVETIYIAPTTMAAAPTISADGVGVVTAPGAVIASVATQSGVQRRFSWIEGELETGGDVVRLYDSRFSVLRNVVGDGTVRLQNASANRIQTLRVATNNDPFVVDPGSSFNLFEDVVVFQGHASGVRVNGHDNVLAGVLAASSVVGIYIQSGADSNVLLGASSMMSGNSSLWISSSDDTTVLGYASINGFRGITVAQSTGVRVHDAIITDQFVNTSAAGWGIQRDASSTVTISGLLRTGGNDRDCVIGVADTVCTTFSPGVDYAAGVTLSASFVGATADAQNPDDDGSGQAAYSLTLDQHAWDSMGRGWGLAGTFPSADVKGDCFTSDTCQIWDWSLLASDTVARGFLDVPTTANAVTVAHTWTADSPTCSAIDGTWSGTCTTEVIAHAREISQDGVGNDNLLCEPGEVCVVLPNAGHYLGHGGWVDAGTGGPAGDVDLRARATNGY